MSRDFSPDNSLGESHVRRFFKNSIVQQVSDASATASIVRRRSSLGHSMR
jgi:hypothetical protein